MLCNNIRNFNAQFVQCSLTFFVCYFLILLLFNVSVNQIRPVTTQAIPVTQVATTVAAASTVVRYFYLLNFALLVFFSVEKVIFSFYFILVIVKKINILSHLN